MAGFQRWQLMGWVDKGILLILEGRGGWGWHKFAGELSKAKDFLIATVGCASGSLLSAEKKGGKEEGPSFGSSPVGVSSSVVMKDRKEVLGLKVSSPSSDGAWPICGWRSSVVRGGGEVRGPCQVSISSG
jgi:hypothetical protein